jgi:hypothetical protein
VLDGDETEAEFLRHFDGALHALLCGDEAECVFAVDLRGDWCDLV